MKQIISILLLSLACWSCEEKVDPYQGESGIYFDTQDIYTDTVRVAWGLKNSDVTQQDLKLKVCLFGDVADYDRSFRIQIVAPESDSLQGAEGTDWLPFATEYAIPAGKAETYITITVLRRNDLESRPRRFAVKLEENAELKFLYSREVLLDTAEWADGNQYRQIDFQRVIYMNENFTRPNWWSQYGNSYFGTYSTKKMILICDVMGIDREVWIARVDQGGPSQNYLKFAGKYMQRWLNENPTEDENEEDGWMKMGSASQN